VSDSTRLLEVLGKAQTAREASSARG
jgi:hypothetical protein